MSKLNRTQLSEYRCKIRDLVGLIETRAFSFCTMDSLVRGSPGKVYRKCSEPTCKCKKGDEHRHGPYKVIQVYCAGKHRQITVPKHKEHLWDKANAWQEQKKNFADLKETCRLLEDLIVEVLEKRIEDVE